MVRRLSSARGGELHPVVDAGEFAGVVGDVGADRTAGVPGDGEHVGDVQLALLVVGVQPGQGVPQDAGVEGEDAGVDLVDLALGVGGVLLLGDMGDFTLLVADDPPVAEGVGQPHGQHGDGGGDLGVSGEQLGERVAGE